MASHERTISAALKAHLALTSTTLALCWRIRRVDGTVYYFTEHDVVIPYNGHDYTPVGSGSVSNFKQTNTLSSDNQDFNMVLSSITEDDLRAGLFDNAEIWTFKINYMDTSQGILKLARGRFGEIEIKDNSARIEFKGLTQLLSTPIGRIFTPECNASLGDSRCAVSMAAHTFAGTVNVVATNKAFTISGAASGKANDYYNYGKIVFSSGLNNGVTMQVEDYNSSTNGITLIELLPFTVANGDAFTLYAGCDRRKSTCIGTFNNFVNFRGFPDLPGLDKIVVIPMNVQWISY